jgi:hypothetical protein
MERKRKAAPLDDAFMHELWRTGMVRADATMEPVPHIAAGAGLTGRGNLWRAPRLMRATRLRDSGSFLRLFEMQRIPRGSIREVVKNQHLMDGHCKPKI